MPARRSPDPKVRCFPPRRRARAHARDACANRDGERSWGSRRDARGRSECLFLALQEAFPSEMPVVEGLLTREVLGTETASRRARGPIAIEIDRGFFLGRASDGIEGDRERSFRVRFQRDSSLAFCRFTRLRWRRESFVTERVCSMTDRMMRPTPA